MDERAEMLLQRMEDTEKEMVRYLKEGASVVEGTTLIYEKGCDTFDSSDRRFYLFSDGIIREEARKSPTEDFTKQGEMTVDKFAEEYKQKALKQAVRALGKALEGTPVKA